MTQLVTSLLDTRPLGAARVAQFFAAGGSLTINGGTPSVGRSAITQAAQGFMTAFSDLRIRSVEDW